MSRGGGVPCHHPYSGHSPLCRRQSQRDQDKVRRYIIINIFCYLEHTNDLILADGVIRELKNDFSKEAGTVPLLPHSGG